MAVILAIRVGRHLARLRDASKLRQVDVAAITGISQVELSRIENGKYPGLGIDTLERLCRALNVTVKEFFASLPEA